MTTNINWAERPEGTTHALLSGKIVLWYKKLSTSIYLWVIADKKWVEIVADFRPRPLISVPEQPKTLLSHAVETALNHVKAVRKELAAFNAAQENDWYIDWDGSDRLHRKLRAAHVNLGKAVEARQ